MKKKPIILRSPESLIIKSPNFKRKTIFSLLQLNQQSLQLILNYLRLSEVVAFYESVRFSLKLEMVKGMAFRYMITSERKYSKWEQKEFLQILFSTAKIKIDQKTKIALSANRLSLKAHQLFQKGNSSPSPSNYSEESSLLVSHQEKIGNDVRRTFLKIDKENQEASAFGRKKISTSNISNYSKMTDQRETTHQEEIDQMQKYLNLVLMAISKRNSHLGYIQGFNYIVKNMYLTGLSEEEAFKLMQFLIEDRHLGNLLEKGMNGLKQLSYILKVYIYNYLPQVYSCFQLNDLDIQIFSTSWFITLFSQDLPPQIVNKIWHLFILQGWKVFIQFAIALLCCYKPNIMSKNGPQIFQYMRSLLSRFNAQRRSNQEIEGILWKLMASIDVSDFIILNLSRQMNFVHRDAQIEIYKLYQTRNSKRSLSQRSLYSSQEQIERSASLSSKLCCDPIHPPVGCESPKIITGFPFCRNINRN